jgi:hypothetical protein
MTVTPEAPPETHAGRTTLEVAITARTMQLAIRARLLRDVTALWPALDKNRLGETFPGWVRAMSLLVRNYHGQSAAAASAAYREARAQATMSPAPRSLVKLAPAPSDEWMRQAFGFSGPGMLNKDTARPNTALSTTLGTASRIALDGGRTTTLETVKHDPVALGWYRVTDGAPCAFCALLASRPALKHEDGSLRKGALYGEHSFDASNARFDGPGEFKVHNDCGCSMAPMFSTSDEMPAVNQKAAEVYANRGDGPALKAFRKAWAEHLASQSA